MVTTAQIEQGLAKWLDTELMPQLPMEGWKRVVAGAAMGVIVKRSGQMLDSLAQSPLFTALEVSKNGEIDIDIIAEELQKATPEKGFVIDLPLIGSMTIHRQDIDNLHRIIRGEYHGSYR